MLMKSVSYARWESSWLSLAFLAATFIVNGSMAHAQTVVNPRAIRFPASLDHEAIAANNEPIVSGYRLAIYRSDSAQPVIVAELGKPAPDPDGYITASLATLVLPPSLYGELLNARAGAVGPDGANYSNLSTWFLFNTCSYTVRPRDQFVAAEGGTLIATVTAASGCTWSATSTVSWMSLVAGATGIGDGSITYTVASNPTTASRTGSLTVANQTISITEAGQPIPSAPPPNALPVVELTNPLNGASLRAPATITLTATAADADGTIKRVDFYAGGSRIGSSTTPPFTTSWNDVAAGTYTLTAVATDNSGGQTTSKSVEITVTRKKVR